jgi:hypothetical protein
LMLENLATKHEPFQAIIVDDSSFVYESDVRDFVVEQYNRLTSVVYMAIEGIYDLSLLQRAFGVDWRLAAYTKRNAQLTANGLRIIGRKAFPFHDQYTKANYVSSAGHVDEELFTEFVNPDDYKDELEDEDSDYDQGIPTPSPGSPVLTSIDGNRSVSYYGFVNPLDVSHGAIILRLCYAAMHHNSGHGEEEM